MVWRLMLCMYTKKIHISSVNASLEFHLHSYKCERYKLIFKIYLYDFTYHIIFFLKNTHTIKYAILLLFSFFQNHRHWNEVGISWNIRDCIILLKWNPQNCLIIWQTCVEVAKILWYLNTFEVQNFVKTKFQIDNFYYLLLNL